MLFADAVHWEHKEVALLAEGVDRNLMGLKAGNPVQMSPSSRRAWIEIDTYVSLCWSFGSRPPRGGRG